MSHRSFYTVNPANDEIIARHNLMSLNEVSAKAKMARKALEKWSRLKFDERVPYLRALAKVLRAGRAEYAKLITTEMGKTISQSEAEVEKCAWTAEVYAKSAGGWLAEESVKTDAKASYVIFQPLGVVLSVMPWNFPFWQVLRFAIPALVAGNTTILRHSNTCPGSSLAIEEAFLEAGFPEGVFNSIITDHQLLARVIQSDSSDAVSFTGSVEAGRTIGELAGRNLKKFVLELGGSDPFIVLKDANVKEAAKAGANARLICSGQSCIAAKRFIVEESVADEFTIEFVEQMGRKSVGDPMNHKTDVGPLVNRKQVKVLHRQVSDALSKGARVLLGGKPIGGRGAFYEPTVLKGANQKMKVMREEVFGPVAPIYSASDEQEAIAVANGSEFGLGASIWTRDEAQAGKIALQIESGVVFVNELVKSDPRMPFGGIKRSGIGRELSKYGLREFVNVKSVNLYGLEDTNLGPTVTSE